MTGALCGTCKATLYSPEHPTCAREDCPGRPSREFLDRFPVAQVDAERGTVRLPEPYARLGNDVVVCDFNWDHPKWHSPRDWIFHDVKRGRRLFQVRKAHAGDAPSVEVLLALLSAFADGERLGKDTGRHDGRAELAGEVRNLLGVGSAA